MAAKVWRQKAVAAFAAALMAVLAAPSSSVAKCSAFNGTADGWNKEVGTEAAVGAVYAAIEQWKAQNGVTGAVKITPQKPEPHPYWRSTVSPDLLLEPDVVSETTYTTCWKGVVSKVVCTSGAKVCDSAAAAAH